MKYRLSETTTCNRFHVRIRLTKAAEGIRRHRAIVHAVARHVPGGLEPDFDQQRAFARLAFRFLDSSAWACSDLWLGRNVHHWHRLLFPIGNGHDLALCGKPGMV